MATPTQTLSWMFAQIRNCAATDMDSQEMEKLVQEAIKVNRMSKLAQARFQACLLLEQVLATTKK
jgi:hypothetical protein